MTKESAKTLLKDFPALDRDVIVRRFGRQEAPAETCKALDITPAEYNKIVARALRELRYVTDLESVFRQEAP